MAEHDVDGRYAALYEQYGKPLEAMHAGEYLAVTYRGETLLGSTLLDVAQQAAKRFGPGMFIYKIGERAVGRWR